MGTGLANPRPVVQTFLVDDDIAALYELDAIVTVVDAKHLITRLDDHDVENETQEQLAFADLILLNKIDLVSDEKELIKIEKRIRDYNPNANIIRSEQSKVDWKKLIGIGAFDVKRVLEFNPTFLTNLDEGKNEEHSHNEGHSDDGDDHEHLEAVTSVSVKFEGELLAKAMQQWVSELVSLQGGDLFRYKGVFACKGIDRKFVFQGVGMLFSGKFSEISWAKDETRECRFVFIGRNLDKKELIDGVNACRVDNKALRFKVGDAVLANVGKWTPGHILKQWDNGNPYRIQLDNDDLTNVWGPMDNDTYVKANPNGKRIKV